VSLPMSARMVKGICIVGAMDVAYRFFLRDFARRWVGIESPAIHV
jgi:hypothetical protein